MMVHYFLGFERKIATITTIGVHKVELHSPTTVHCPNSIPPYTVPIVPHRLVNSPYRTTPYNVTIAPQRTRYCTVYTVPIVAPPYNVPIVYPTVHCPKSTLLVCNSSRENHFDQIQKECSVNFNPNPN